MRLLGYELTIEVARTDDVDERYRSTDTMAQVEIAAAPLVIHPIVMSEPHAIDATFGAVTTISDCVGTGVATAVGVGGCGVGTELGTIVGRGLNVGNGVGNRVGNELGRGVGRGPQRTSVVGDNVDGAKLGASVVCGHRYTGAATCVFARHDVQLQGHPMHSSLAPSAQVRFPSPWFVYA
jgi:hypothetical protein